MESLTSSAALALVSKQASTGGERACEGVDLPGLRRVRDGCGNGGDSDGHWHIGRLGVEPREEVGRQVCVSLECNVVRGEALPGFQRAIGTALNKEVDDGHLSGRCAPVACPVQQGSLSVASERGDRATNNELCPVCGSEIGRHGEGHEHTARDWVRSRGKKRVNTLLAAMHCQVCQVCQVWRQQHRDDPPATRA